MHPAISPSKDQGIDLAYWFWGAADELSKKAKANPPPISVNNIDKETDVNSDEEINKLLLEYPQANAAAFLGALKSKGYKLIKPDLSVEKPVDKKPVKNEADSADANTQVLRQSAFKFKANLREAISKDDGIGPTKFRVVLLQEGLGNMRDAYYYSKDALNSAVSIFEGKKIFADHPTAEEENIRPERSVRDVLGHFENITVEESEGIGQLMGDVVIMADKPYEWARALMRHSIEYAKKFPEQEFIGLSINASGDAQEIPLIEVLKTAPEKAKLKLSELQNQGSKTVRLVSVINDATSCDLVTEAGAGGKILNLLEGEKDMEPKHDDKAQDIELIKKMLDEYVGGGNDMIGEEKEAMHKLAHEALEGYKEMGYSEEEAMKHAGHALKLAKHMSKKQSEAKQSEDADVDDVKKKEDEEKHSEDEAKHAEGEKKEDECKEEEKKKESKVKELERQLLEAKGKLAALELKDKKTEVEKYVETKLSESKKPRAFTKAFREAAGEIKTKEEFESKWTIFCEGSKNKQVELDWSVMSEKSVAVDAKASNGKKLNFSGCAE